MDLDWKFHQGDLRGNDLLPEGALSVIFTDGAKFSPDDKVFGLYTAQGKWYPATIKECQGGG